MLLVLVLLFPAVAWPCSLRLLPVGATPLSAGSTPAPRLDDGGADTTPPATPVLSNPKVNLVDNPCTGSGWSCPQLDWFEFTVASGDLETPVERLRYVAAFGATAAEAAAAEPSLLFHADASAPTVVRASLGLNGARSGVGFDRQALCFTLSAVDDGANLSPRSEALCVDTLDRAASTTSVTQGNACGLGCGCSAPSGATGAWVALFSLVWLGAARGRAPARAARRSRDAVSPR